MVISLWLIYSLFNVHFSFVSLTWNWKCHIELVYIIFILRLTWDIYSERVSGLFSNGFPFTLMTLAFCYCSNHSTYSAIQPHWNRHLFSHIFFLQKRNKKCWIELSVEFSRFTFKNFPFTIALCYVKCHCVKKNIEKFLLILFVLVQLSDSIIIEFCMNSFLLNRAMLRMMTMVNLNKAIEE